MSSVFKKMEETLCTLGLGPAGEAKAPVLLMVSGGSDSVALAYAAHELAEQGKIGPLHMLHVNHCLRGAAADADEAFVVQLAECLGIPLTSKRVDVAALARAEGGNTEALARRERYACAAQAASQLSAQAARGVASRAGALVACEQGAPAVSEVAGQEGALASSEQVALAASDGGFSAPNQEGAPAPSQQRPQTSHQQPAPCPQTPNKQPAPQVLVFTAHTADDRVENFYMRSIVGTGPGGFRSMDYTNNQLLAPALLVRPLLGVGRETLRAYLRQLEASGAAVARDPQGALWREDATNACTDQLRAYVRHTMVPAAKKRNPQLLETLGRSMDLIASEDDMLQKMADELAQRFTQREGAAARLLPGLGIQPVPLTRRVVVQVLHELLPSQARIETASVCAVLKAWDAAGTPQAKPRGGYVANIQGNLAVSANKQGVLIEPMQEFRKRRKK